MHISAINGINHTNLNVMNTKSITDAKETNSFDDVLSAIMGSVNETNELQNDAESEAIRFALGESENTHDLLIAQTKANVALQYTVAVKNGLIDAYKEIMQISV